ncbi:MAG: radical SAM protein [Planctomycetota bacterium]
MKRSPASQNTLVPERGGEGAAVEPALEERLDRLARRLLPGKRPSYHAFRVREAALVYELLTGTLLELGPVVFRVLEGIERRVPAPELRGRLADVDDAELVRALAELEACHEAGLFRTEEADRPKDLERVVGDALMATRPRKLMLMVQTSCNLKCTYCYEVQNGFHQTGSRMDLETGKRSIELLIERSGRRPYVEITFFGGEPLLNFRLIRELVAYCGTRAEETGKRFHFQLTTNATLLSDEVIAFLVEHRFGVMVSIDGPPEWNDLHRVDLEGRGSGEAALDGARRLVAAQRAAGLREAMVRVTMTHENHDGAAIYRFFQEQGFRRIMLGASTGRADGRDPWDIDAADAEEMAQAGDDCLEAYLRWLDGETARPADADRIEKGVRELLPALTAPSTVPSIRCGVGRNMTAVTRDGTLYPCHRYAGDEAFELGTLETGLDRDKLRDYYDRVLRVKESHCSQCWARITCGGQCPWHISTSEGAILEPDEPSCDGIRRGHERLLYLIHRLQRAGRLEGEPAIDPEACSNPE